MDSEIINAKNDIVKAKQKWYKDLVTDNSLNEILPKVFTVKYLGKCPAQGLWGIEYTRKPVDDIVAKAKVLTHQGERLPIYDFKVSEVGVNITISRLNKNPKCQERFFPINLISYGVQDGVYRSIFAMITIKETTSTTGSPFDCYCFACECPEDVNRVIRALAMAFKRFVETEEAMEGHAHDFRKPSLELDDRKNSNRDEDEMSEMSEA